MAREIGQHPAGRAAALRHDGAELDERAIGQLAAADALRLQHAEEAARVQIGDGLIGEAAQLLGRARPRPQRRHERLGPRRERREIGRGGAHAGPEYRLDIAGASIGAGRPLRRWADFVVASHRPLASNWPALEEVWAMAELKTDWDIANSVTPRPILDIAKERLGIPAAEVEPYGHYKAKIGLGFAQRCFDERPDGKLIVVTAINPTPAGEGKTTTSVGLADALNRIGKKTMLCLREPSLGPCFGVKGGAAGGGWSQVIPMDDINLHFTGDLHAVAAANNLLAAMVDNHIYWGSEPVLDPRRVSWRRCLDMNDRALRQVVSSLGGVANGFPREDGFDITVASEVMAILCLAQSTADLERRLANIVVGATRDRKPVRAQDLKAEGAMAALLKDALKPNLVQTLEHNPAFVHGGPFANIAHGCNTAMATRLALKLADYVVTEAGFGADLGAEKFFDIKCRKTGLKPDAAVIVASVRALKFHGGLARADLGKDDAAAVTKGMANLARHITNVQKFGVPPLVCVNRFGSDSEAELAAVARGLRRARRQGVRVRALGQGQRRRGALGARRGRDDRRGQGRFPHALSRRHEAHRQDPHHRPGNLWRGRGDGAEAGAGPARRARENGLRRAPHLHGEDAIQLLVRSRLARRADGLRAARARGAAFGRRRVRGRDLRRHHDHAGPAARALGA